MHDERTIASEMAWLTVLAEDTDLGVPAPVAARDGSLEDSESTPGVPGGVSVSCCAGRRVGLSIGG